MKSKFLLIISALLLVVNLMGQSTEKIDIEKIIIDSYIKGLINAENFEDAKKGIHKDFEIFGHRDTLLTKKSRDKWIDQRSKRKNLEKVNFVVEFIDVEGDAASAKIKMTRGNIIAVDYIFLYNFNGSWKIVSAIDYVKRK